MDLIRGSLQNPIGRFMFAIGLILLGIIAFSKLAIDLFPDITYPVVSVLTEYEGAAPEDVEVTLTRPVEKRLSRIQNVKNISSRSLEGLSIVTAEFYWGTNLDTATDDIQQALNQIIDDFPDDAKRPVIFKFDPSQISVITFAVTGTMDEWKLRELAEDTIAPRLESIPGVAAANVFGGKRREIQVLVERSRMEASGISILQVVDGIRQANTDVPGGNLKAGSRDYNVRTLGRSTRVAFLEDLVVSNRNGVPVRVKDIGRVADGFEEEDTETRVNSGAGLVIGVQKQIGGNTVSVVDTILKALPAIQRDLPKGTVLEVINDQSRYIRKSIKNLQHEAMIGALLATSIVLIFLRNVSSTLIVATSIPISILSTFILLHVNHLTLNIMTLGGLALGVGRLLDDAIVVLENINRHLDMGEPPEVASYEGTREVSKPVIAATITSIIVFVPLAFVEGIATVLFLQMAYTVAFSLLASLFDSLTLVPVLTSKILGRRERPVREESLARRFFVKSQDFFNGVDQRYQNLLSWALKRRRLVFTGTGGVLVASLLLVPAIGSEFFPKSDEGNVRISLRLPVGTRLEETRKVIEQIEAVVRSEVPEVEAMFARAGSGRGRSVIFGGRFTGPHTGFVSLTLSDKSRRRRSSEQIAAALRPKLSRIPGAIVTVNSGGLVSRVISFGSEEPLRVEIIGYDLGLSSRLAREVAESMRSVPGVTDIQVSREEGQPEYNVRIQHDRVSNMGLTVSRVADTVKSALGGKVASVYIDPATGREHNIRVRLQEADRGAPRDIERITLPMDSRGSISLGNVAELVAATSPTRIERKYQQRAVFVTADSSGRDFGSVAREIESNLGRLQVPEGFSMRLRGSREDQQQAFRSLAFALLLAIVLIYMVLSAQFGSLVHPFLIMFSVPLGFIGVIWALFLTGITLSVISFIGIIMMVGIVVSNAILLVDYTNLLRARGVELDQAVVQAGRTRLRPILMTTLTTLLGLSPMALGIGEGAEANAPLAITVIGGLSVSTFLTLVFLPALYHSVERYRLKRRA
ncbi:MAG: efflux RND transporter permease subunit [Candidatus Tectomicrobia bacterium]|uniref:Efflux RND transporter permease subunit n=1 Tax=Tectimicrobiota bacterium TaxID=2528274 RepID=A0A932GLR9_UNCTE|nr:efflux RND transporter permease subunit [Candidatus Tectomicrobia bacterium]